MTACLLLLFTTSCAEKVKENSSKSEIKKPNVILFLADDQGWGDLNSSGNRNLNTPNIDALKTNGASFNNFYVQPVCSPTRAEILTGRYFTRTGVYETSSGGERINLNETTIADILKKAGYHTAAFGKWHNGMQPPYHPNSRGFDEYYGFASGHWGNYFSPMLEHNGTLVKGNGFLVDDLTDKGLEFIENNKTEPFFLYLPYNTPHSPMQVPDEFWNKMKDKSFDFLSDEHVNEDLQFTKAALAMVENIDYNVGRITDKVKSLNLEDETIIIYLSDNGPNAYRWNGGMKGKKGNVDEGGVRTPFYIQWTNHIQKGFMIDEIASGIDILPTLTGLLSIPLRTKMPIDGEDLSPLLLGETIENKNRFIYNHWNGKTSIRSQNFRLDNENRLYDITNDRAQLKDIASSNTDIVKVMLEAKNNWEIETINTTKENDNRAFTLGYPKAIYTQLPARDGEAHGNIKRSNRWPNDSFFTNWKSVNDAITWNVEILEEGRFQVKMYYTCPEKDLGAIVELSFETSKIAAKITKPFNPPLVGKEEDRVPRMESYVKEFKPLNLGVMTLPKGKGTLTLKAIKVPNGQVGDFRLLQFKKVE
ncbi:N-acetylgalactosamine 6-sulfate sulfatase [Maribacter hydrothermalis]|uniref:N-acetylgalactosamine 6-sulfate sulfatase n=1 Tax=Maribacter hydrothermalis TaxID=1836467 RepID=A0A1B7Z0N2_9FLAO|nr:N-acetylgalactosamine 6-sulfate sulfatase [Maribacter hydrothermalis]OBR36100.1 N-acetylgalactosamine 6-sulfate sulfatase [Maribacter hydrothermalis]